MAANTSLEDRVAALETAMREMQSRFPAPEVDPDWLERFKGAFRDDPDFAEVIRLGREFRNSDRPVVPAESEGVGQKK